MAGVQSFKEKSTKRKICRPSKKKKKRKHASYENLKRDNLFAQTRKERKKSPARMEEAFVNSIEEGTKKTFWEGPSVHRGRKEGW